MKKLMICLLTLCILIFGLCACSGTEAGNGDKTTVPATDDQGLPPQTTTGSNETTGSQDNATDEPQGDDGSFGVQTGDDLDNESKWTPYY